MIRACLALGLGAWLLGCAALGPPRPVCDAALVPPARVPEGFRVEGTYRSNDGEAGTLLRVVLAKQGAQVVLVALTAVGAEAFQVVQEETGPRVESALGPVLEIAPLDVLADLHRIYFHAALPPPAGEVVVERARGRVVVRRPDCGREASFEAAAGSGPDSP